jgi:3-phosphoshikimate 1-carboxyvinyltransferase
VGKDSLARRPLREYAEILGPRGVRLEFAGEQNLPVKVGGKLQSGVFQVPGHISSQYITGLMLALPLLEGDSTIVLTTPLQSAPYVEMTQAVLDLFGIVVRPAAAGWVVPGRQKYVLPEELELEADYSQAAFWLAAKSLGHALEVEGLSVKSVQGDREIIPLLEEMGRWKPGEERRIDAAQIPDLVPILAVVALARPGVTILENAQRLRFKESDRLLSTAEMLGSMGAKIAATTDSLLIHGGEQLTGGEVDAHNDHRIAMAAAISALNSRNGATIMGADAVGKSYPGFFQELQRLGGDVRGI